MWKPQDKKTGNLKIKMWKPQDKKTGNLKIRIVETAR
jgi:hypothetical protein